MTAKTAASPLWAHVQLLATIARTGSFTLAAQRLALSKAAVSQRLAELERAVGVPLVRRTTRSVRLTDAGARLVEDTAASFAHIEASLERVRELAAEPRGLVRLSAPVALGRQHVAPSLESFLRAWPGIRVELELDDRLVNLAREGFDLAVRHTSAAPESHVAWRLCASRTLLVASSAYLRKRGRPEHPSELEAHDSLLYLRPGPAQWMFERAHGGAEPERVSVAVQGPLRVNNSEVLRDAVLAGLGLGQLPDFSAAAALRAGRLQALLPDWRPVGSFGDAIYAIRPWTPQVPRAVRALVEHLRTALAPGFGSARS